MSTVNDVIVSYGGTVKGIQETSRQKKNLKRVGTPFCPGRMLR